jgi:uncharacterized membrane protein
MKLNQPQLKPKPMNPKLRLPKMPRVNKEYKVMMATVRRYFISGLLLWLPIWVTLLVIRFLVEILDNTMSMLPRQYQPDNIFGFHIPGIGVVITLGVIFITGLIAANFLGKSVVRFWDALIGRIPLVRSVYSSVKQVSDTLFTPGGQSFRKVLLVEYPRKGLWTLAFQTGDATPEVCKMLETAEMVSLFVPTTPNPTSGFLMMAARKDVMEMNMTVDQALKFVISLGVVQPGEKSKKLSANAKLKI